jgi:hypothetical protein
MVDEPTGILSIKIDFPTSHLFFPRIMIGVIVVLLVAIAIKGIVPRMIKGTLRETMRKYHFFELGSDKLKLLSTVVVIVAYFILMSFIGRFLPNQGFGFLIMSIPFMLGTSLLFAGREVAAKHKLSIILTGVLTPLGAWFLFGRLFLITLP